MKTDHPLFPAVETIDAALPQPPDCVVTDADNTVAFPRSRRQRPWTLRAQSHQKAGPLGELLQRTGWAQSELAQRAGVATHTICKLVNDTRCVPTESVANAIQRSFAAVGEYFDVLTAWPEIRPEGPGFHRKSRSHSVSATPFTDVEPSEILAVPDDTCSGVQEGEMHTALHELLQVLPPSARVELVGRFLERQTFAALALVSKTNQNIVRERIRHSLNKLRRVATAQQMYLPRLVVGRLPRGARATTAHMVGKVSEPRHETHPPPPSPPFWPPILQITHMDLTGRSSNLVAIYVTGKGPYHLLRSLPARKGRGPRALSACSFRLPQTALQIAIHVAREIRSIDQHPMNAWVTETLTAIARLSDTLLRDKVRHCLQTLNIDGALLAHFDQTCRAAGGVILEPAQAA